MAALPSAYVHFFIKSEAYSSNRGCRSLLMRSDFANSESCALDTSMKSGISPDAMAVFFFCSASSALPAAYQR